MRRQTILTLLFLFLSAGNIIAQKQANDPDLLYVRFTSAYDSLDGGAISELYDEDAELLNLYDGAPSNSIKGRPAIREYFDAFFGSIRSGGGKLTLTFKIADRKHSGGHVLDNGFYALEIIMPGKPSITTYGKFSVVLRATDGGWKFKTDATTNADITEYESVKVRTIPVRQ